MVPPIFWGLLRHRGSHPVGHQAVGNPATREKPHRSTESTRRAQNHWLDALYNACAAGHLCGVRLVEEVKPAPKSGPRGVSEEDADFTRRWLDRYRLQSYPKWGR